MDAPTAWISQAIADYRASERFPLDEALLGHCHAIAKLQQAVEKFIKAVVVVLDEAQILTAGSITRHEVSKYTDTLLRLPRNRDNRAVQNLLRGLFNQETKAGIRSLDSLAPALPPRLNTEYPFEMVTGSGDWTYPAAAGVFTKEDVLQYRNLAHRILEHATRIISSVRRRPQ